jgi:hypothetical protein
MAVAVCLLLGPLFHSTGVCVRMFCYYGCMVQFKSVSCWTSNIFLFFFCLRLLCLFWVFCASIWILVFFWFCEECRYHFDGDCIKSVDGFQ